MPPTFCWDLGEKLSRRGGEVRKTQERKEQVINHGNVRGCCLVVYNASGRAFAVNSSVEVSVSIPSSNRLPRVAEGASVCRSFRAEAGVCFAVRDSLTRPESYVLLAFVANG